MESKPAFRPARRSAPVPLVVALWICGALALWYLSYLSEPPGAPAPDWSDTRLSRLELAHAAARLSVYVSTIPESPLLDPRYLSPALRQEALRLYEIEVARSADPEAVVALCVLYHGQGHDKQLPRLLEESVARHPEETHLLGALGQVYSERSISAQTASRVEDRLGRLPTWLQALVLADLYARTGDGNRRQLAQGVAIAETVRFGHWAIVVAVAGALITAVSTLLAVITIVVLLVTRRPQAVQRPTARWTGLDTAEGLGLLFFASALLALIRALLRARLFAPGSGVPGLLGHAAIYVLYVVPAAAVVIARARRRQRDWREALGLRPLRLGRHVAQGIMVFGVTLPLVPALSGWLAGLLHDAFAGWPIAFSQQDAAPAVSVPSARAWLLLSYGVVAVIVAPVAEELIFRGFLYGALRRRLTPLAACGASAVIFAAMHLDPDSAAFGAAMIMGLVLAATYEKTRSLYVPMVVHALTNAYVLAVLVVQTL